MVFISKISIGNSMKRLEPVVMFILGWLLIVAIPVSFGGIGLGWDALNHHVYLGWTAEKERFALDWRAAGSQVYQLPYLYWPLYKLALGDFSGIIAGVVLGTLNALTLIPIWMISKSCIPGNSWIDVVVRGACMSSAYASGVVLSQFDTTLNDILAAFPFLLCIALSLRSTKTVQIRFLDGMDEFFIPGIFAGMAVALKLSNGPIALVLPVFWTLAKEDSRFSRKIIAAGVGGAGIFLGFLMVYAPWGLSLWRYFGSPLYPFF